MCSRMRHPKGLPLESGKCWGGWRDDSGARDVPGGLESRMWSPGCAEESCWSPGCCTVSIRGHPTMR